MLLRMQMRHKQDLIARTGGRKGSGLGLSMGDCILVEILLQAVGQSLPLLQMLHID